MPCSTPSTANATRLFYCVQEDCETLPDNPVFTPFVVTGGTPSVTRDLLQSSVLNGSPEIDYARLGSLSVTGEHALELSHGVHDDLIESAMQSAWITPATQTALPVEIIELGGVVTAVISGVDITADATVGSLIRFTDLALGSNAEPFTITAASFDLTDTHLNLAEIKDIKDPMTGRATSEIGTSDVKFSKRITIGNTNKYIAILAEFTDLEGGTAFDLVTGAEITGFSFDCSVNSVVTGSFPSIGRYYYPGLELADLPAGTTFGDRVKVAPYTAIDGRVMLDGDKLALVSSVTMGLDRGAAGSYEYGSKYISHVSYDTATNSVSAESRFKDYEMLTKYINETPVSVNVAHKLADTNKAISFFYEVAIISDANVAVDTGDNILNLSFQPYTASGSVPSLIIHSID